MRVLIPSQVSAFFSAEEPAILDAGVICIKLGVRGGHLGLRVVGARREPEIHV